MTSSQKDRLERTEGTPWYDCLTCIPILLADYAIAYPFGLWMPEAFGVAFGILLIPMGIVYLWFIGWLMRGRWYLKYDKEGIHYRILFMDRNYEWSDIKRLISRKSPGFMGRYHDTLVLETQGKSVEFFLPNFGLKSKKPTVKFIEGIIGMWQDENPSDSMQHRESREKPSETDEDDQFDDEY